MIIYNITTQVTWKVHDQWRKWLLEIAIPQMLATGLFSHYQLVKLLEVDEESGPTYALQLYVKENCSVGDYKKHHRPAFEQRERALWGDEIISFASLMEVIN